jgi:mono/diheme cytochrome c family protein
MLLLALAFACSGAPETPPPAEAPPVAPAEPAPAADPHAAHGAGGHMEQMAATREKLRTELGEAYDQPVAGIDAADLGRGKELYATHCESCHGADGKGGGPAAAGLNPPPADFTDAFHARYYSDAGRVRIIEKGSPGTAMAAFEGTLDDAQIVDVYAYVRTFRGDAPAAAEHDHSTHQH